MSCSEFRAATPPTTLRADLLKHRSLLAARELESDAVRAVEPVYRVCERLRPLLGWLAGHTVEAPEGAEVAAGPAG